MDELPDGIVAMAARGPHWADWVRRLPGQARDLTQQWDLVVDGSPMHGHCSIAIPVRAADERPAVLKITFDSDEESEFEHLALQAWRGDGAVRLLRADPHRRAMLLERLHLTDLSELPDLAACEVVAGLYRRLHRPALPQLNTIASHVEHWCTGLARLPHDAPIPRRMVSQALSLARELTADPVGTTVIVHGDLHYQNVLAADREPWLAIDPKPMAGDPHYEPAPMLWNRMDELSADLRAGLRRRFHTLVEVGELDVDRARAWVIVRMVVNAFWALQDAEREGRRLTGDDHDWVTSCIAITKAVQD